ncbi:MAG: HAMP domain-containing histidine kinase, partial [Rhodospirillaceae bacterium]|nr:HAMP domain-containing histidine kinase [Rhodospirillaceae bacterium]
ADGVPTPNPVLGSPDVGWIWQISEGKEIIDRSALLRLTGTTLKSRVTKPGVKFTISDVASSLGAMRIAERIVDEVPPFSAENGEPEKIRVHYLVGVSAEQYADYVAQHTARLRDLFVLALIPVSVAILGMLTIIVLALRRDLGRVASSMDHYEDGAAETIEGAHPRELQRLVDRMNGLLQQNTMLIDRTRKYVSKIAHDINHPLAIMKNGLNGAVDTALLGRQVDRMAGLVDRYSSLARAIGPEGQVQRQTEIAATLEDIAEGFSILYRRTPLDISCVCDSDLTFFVARHDLEAMVSNLVSNAHKFADEKVILGAELRDGNLVVRVEDDGPGITVEQREAALHWGGRLDEAPPGTGFGLSIVRDIVALYDGDMRLGEAGAGGLSVEIELPGKRR